MSDDGVKERWLPGEWACFEYHCHEGEDSADARLWHRTHRLVTVMSGPHGDPALAKDGMPYTYRVRFRDGYKSSAWEDELLTSSEFYTRPGHRAGLGLHADELHPRLYPLRHRLARRLFRRASDARLAAAHAEDHYRYGVMTHTHGDKGFDPNIAPVGWRDGGDVVMTDPWGFEL